MRNTTGKQLKETLGLNNLNFVSCMRLLETTQKIMVVLYDTKRSNVPITTYRALKAYGLFSARVFPFEKEIMNTPLIPLEDYNGPLERLMVISIDLSGYFGDKDKQIQKEKIWYFSSKEKLNEYLQLSDFKDTEATSDFTKNTISQRYNVVRSENVTSELLDCQIDTVEDHVTFIFLTEVTEPIYPDNYEFGETDPENNFQIKKNPSKTYELYIRILDFMKILKETRPDYMEDKKITRKEIKDVLETANIQVYNTSPSFHWQGINYWASQLDGSVYPTDIKPQRWNQPHLHGNDGAFLDKHLAGLFKSIDFWLNPMSSMLTKRMKNRNLL